jgi:acyl carrier protein
MDNTITRLIACFRTVFPDVLESEIVSASQSGMAGWDSVATITLMNVVEEEFGVMFDLDRMEEFESFDGIERYLRSEQLSR